MILNSKVALVTPGEDNVNHLCIPEFGVHKLCLKTSRKASKSYLQQGASPPKKTERGSDDFHFAPGPQLNAKTWEADESKSDKVSIVYELSNPNAAIKEAKLELFRRFNERPGKSVSANTKDISQLHGRTSTNSTPVPVSYATASSRPSSASFSAVGMPVALSQPRPS